MEKTKVNIFTQQDVNVNKFILYIVLTTLILTVVVFRTTDILNLFNLYKAKVFKNKIKRKVPKRFQIEMSIVINSF